MKTRQQAITYGLTFPHTYVESPFKDPNWELVRVKGSKKAFLWVYEKDGYINLNIKVDPEWREFWREAYDAVIPGYHQNKKYWNTIILDGTIPEKDIKKMIKESYDIITDSPTKRIYEAVKQIPKGHVATYGQVAAMAGNPKMSRAVGNALHKNPDPENIPCFRVVNAKGELAGAFAFGGEGKQAKLLEEDGVAVVDMTMYDKLGLRFSRSCNVDKSLRQFFSLELTLCTWRKLNFWHSASHCSTRVSVGTRITAL